MSRLVLTYDLALAASKDAANVHMRAERRTAWNVEDYAIACQTLDRLWPVQHVHDCTPPQEATP